MKLSVIIPVLNEEKTIERAVHFFQKNGDARLLEIIVVDGKSTDRTVELAKKAGATVVFAEKQSRIVLCCSRQICTCGDLRAVLRRQSGISCAARISADAMEFAQGDRSHHFEKIRCRSVHSAL